MQSPKGKRGIVEPAVLHPCALFLSSTLSLPFFNENLEGWNTFACHKSGIFSRSLGFGVILHVVRPF